MFDTFDRLVPNKVGVVSAVVSDFDRSGIPLFR